MRDDLQIYYERELTYLRQTATEFAQKYPGVASRLGLEPSKCNDPHVERLLEGFAFLAARVHLKIDDEFPEITEALLGVIYPHFIRPIPSMSIVDFQVDLDQGKLTTAWPIPKGTTLYSRPVGGTPCKFRTCYDTTLWPIAVTAVDFRTPDRLQPPIRSADAAIAIRIELRCAPDAKLPQLQIDRLRFYLDGESALVHTLYEMLCCNLISIVVRDPTPRSKAKPFTLPASSLRPVGFERDEGMLPYTPRSFIGYRLLQELFTFPEKFFFIDVTGLESIWATGFNNRAELIFLLSGSGEDRRDRLATGLSPGTFRLGCAPVINLFSQTAEGILWNHQTYEYPVVPDRMRPAATEIFSIDEVLGVTPEAREPIRFEPFYSAHENGSGSSQCFWVASRRPSNLPNDHGTEMFLSLVDLSLRPARPSADTVVVRTTCTNRDLPARLPFGNEAWDFELEGNSPIRRITSLKIPTAPLRPPLGRAALWHLISHLSLNHLSIVEEGKEALKQILKLYNFTESPFSQKMIESVTDLKSRRDVARLISDAGISFAHGWRVELELDEEQFVGGGYYLFASVIEHFLGLYVSLNSFIQLSLRTRQRREVVREWPPRAGSKILM